MKAMIIITFGGPEVFQEREMPTPAPNATEVLVRIHATSISTDWAEIRQTQEVLKKKIERDVRDWFEKYDSLI